MLLHAVGAAAWLPVFTARSFPGVGVWAATLPARSTCCVVLCLGVAVCLGRVARRQRLIHRATEHWTCLDLLVCKSLCVEPFQHVKSTLVVVPLSIRAQHEQRTTAAHVAGSLSMSTGPLDACAWRKGCMSAPQQAHAAACFSPNRKF